MAVLAFAPFTFRGIINKNKLTIGAHLENGIVERLTWMNTQLKSPIKAPVLSMVVMLEKQKGGGNFNSFQFRALNKKEEIFRVHCENMFFEWVSKDLDFFENDKFKENPIAFFILLQKSEGGELSLFDKRWEQGQRVESLASGFDQIVNDNEVNDCSPQGIKRQLIDAEECEMILFNGGKIWHNIEKIKSSKERITVGALLEISDEGNHLVWI